MVPVSSDSYAAGVGGKLQSRPRRRATTPYDRTAGNRKNSGGDRGLLSRLVDPASRLLQSVFFRKRFPPLPEPIPKTGVNDLPRFSTDKAYSKEEEKQHVNDDRTVNNESGESGINELEQLLKQKTFTRDEYDRLMELLRSRTVGLSAEDPKPEGQHRMAEPSLSNMVCGKDDVADASDLQDDPEISRVFRRYVPDVCDENAASPAELAKAYMGARPSRRSPSALGLRSQMFREHSSLLNNLPISTPKSTTLPFQSKSALRLHGNGLLTPRTPGKSAVYSMPRPSSEVQYATAMNNTELVVNGSVEHLTSSQQPRATNMFNKQSLKRRSLVLDNDFGSGGSIRRIRQKSSLWAPSKGMKSMIPGIPSASMNVVEYDAARLDVLEASKCNRQSKLQCTDSGVGRVSSALVPSQSSEMARKILQQLDRLVPSPKDKSSELSMAKKLPTKLTFDMLNVQARKSLEDPESRLTSMGGNCSLDGLSCEASLPLKVDTVSIKGKEIGTASYLSSALVSKKTYGVDQVRKNCTITTSNTTRAEDSVVSAMVSKSMDNKLTFCMSVPEDFVEPDEDKTVVPLPAAKEVQQPSFSETISATFAGDMDKALSPSAADVEVVHEVQVSHNKPSSILSKIGKATADVSSETNNPSSPRYLEDTLSCLPPTEITTSSKVDVVQNDSTPLEVPEDATPSVSETTSVAAHACENEAASTTIASSSPLSHPPASLDADNVEHKSKLALQLPQSPRISPVFSGTSCGLHKFSVSESAAPEHQKFDLTNHSTAVASSSFLEKGDGSSTLVCDAAVSVSSSHVPCCSGSDILGPPSATSPSSTLFDTSLKTTPSNVLTSGGMFKSASSPGFVFGSQSRDTASSSPFTMSNNIKNNASAFLPSTATFGSSLFGSGTTCMTLLGSQSEPTNADASSGLSSSLSLNANVASSISGSSSQLSTFSASTSGLSFQFATHSTIFGLSSQSVCASGLSTLGSSTSSTTLFGSCSQPSTSNVPALTSQTSNASFSFGSYVPSLSTGFSFGQTSTSAGSLSPIFTSSAASSAAAPLFSFGSVGASSSAAFPSQQNMFQTSSPVSGFGGPGAATDQMNVEDSMAEDTVQATAAQATPSFGQPSSSLVPSNFFFGSPAVHNGGSHGFHFGGQSIGGAQSTSPFPAPTGSLDLPSGGSFSLGTGGGDKANRKYIKARRDKFRRK